MKTVFINCSPKKRFCASQYFLFLQRLFTGGKKVSEKLRNQADHARILDQLKDAQAVAFCLPLHVDGIPSHVLRFMEEMEKFCRQNDIHLNVYCIANNALILLYFNLGVLFYFALMGRAISKGAYFGKKYTRILIPSFVFILFADIFFIIISLFEGGIFRGWLAKKEPGK